jgi:hypothetical protein
LKTWPKVSSLNWPNDDRINKLSTEKDTTKKRVWDHKSVEWNNRGHVRNIEKDHDMMLVKFRVLYRPLLFGLSFDFGCPFFPFSYSLISFFYHLVELLELLIISFSMRRESFRLFFLCCFLHDVHHVQINSISILAISDSNKNVKMCKDVERRRRNQKMNLRRMKKMKWWNFLLLKSWRIEMMMMKKKGWKRWKCKQKERKKRIISFPYLLQFLS